MTALNPIMLWGLLAASIPILIHLLNRRRHRVIDWGAMQFLLASHTSRNRRVLLEEILVLAVRTAMLAALALGLARLFIQNPYFAGSGASAQAVAIVVDTSLSMSREVGGMTVLQRGVAAARQLIDTLSSADTVTVLFASATVEPVTDRPVYATDEGKAALQAQLAGIEPTAASVDMVRAIDTANLALADQVNPVKQIVVITDGQQYGWHLDEPRRWQFLAESLPTDETARPRITVLRLESPDESLVNLAVTSITLDRPIVGTDRPVRITATVTNTGQAASPARTVHVDVGERRLGSREVLALPPGASESLTLTHQFKTSGSVVITATLAGGDPIPLDDSQSLAVQVAQSLPVLLIDGAPSPEPLGSETAYLTAALAPTHRNRDAPVDYLVAARVVEVPDTDRIDLSKFRAVVLANVRYVPDALLTRLRDFVEQGGGLLITPGDQVDRADFNERLYAQGQGLSPVRLAAPVGDATARESFEILSDAAIDHPIMRLFAPPATMDLAKVHVYRWFPLEMSTRAANTRRVASLANGQPLAVEQRLGRGHVICTAVPWDIAWTNLPACKAYVVLTHELMYYLAEPLLPRWHLPPGQSLTVSFDADGAPPVGQVFDPDGTIHAVTGQRNGSRMTYPYRETSAPGVYRLVLSSPQGSTRYFFTVGLDPQESDLTSLDDEAIAHLTEPPLSLAFLETVDQAQRALSVESPGREIWRWLMLTVLLLAIVEVGLTRAIARNRHGDASAEVDLGGKQTRSPSGRG